MNTKSTTSFVKPKPRHRLLSLFPSSNENKFSIKRSSFCDKKSNHSSTSTMNTTSSSTSSIVTMSKRQFHVRNAKFIPNYSHLYKLFLKFQSKFKQRTELVKSQLLPWLQNNTFQVYAHEEWGDTVGFWGLKSNMKETKELELGRCNLLKWWKSLLKNTGLVNSDDKVVYYRIIADIISRPEFLEYDYFTLIDNNDWFQYSTEKRSLIEEYRYLLVTTLKYVIEKLNQKTIYVNLIPFCAKILAICYFKIPGLATSLLKILYIRPTMMKTLLKDMTNLPNQSQNLETLKHVFPPFLHELMVSDKTTYTYVLSNNKINFPFHSKGNWARRWQSDDSELFFSFYKYYHDALKSYIQSSHHDSPALSKLPGFMYLATYFAGKIGSLTQREVLSVTNGTDAIMTNKPSDTNEVNAFVSVVQHDRDYEQYDKLPYSVFQSGKPKPLEVATRRYAECMIVCTTGSDSFHLYHGMLNVWLRSIINKTRLNEADQVYCLIDFIEQVMLELQRFPFKQHVIDIPYILHTLEIILSKSDHSITLLRTLSFIYIHFSLLTSQVEYLDHLCNRIMLNLQIFERLLLHWSKNVRTFFLRCLMWRIGRVWQQAGVRWNSEADQMMKMMVRSHPHSISCDGYSCWQKWQTEYQYATNHIQEYRKISLQIHIVLETLLASFHKYHAEIRHIYDDSQIKRRTMCQNETTHFSKRSCPSPVMNKGHLATRPKTSKEDCTDTTVSSLKLFSKSDASRPTTTCVFNISPSNFGDTCTSPIFKLVQDSLCNIPEESLLLSKQINLPPLVADVARQWKYNMSNHVYAIKVLSEIKAIVHEYCVWLGKANEAKENASMVFVPGLSLEWPKNWTCSTL